MKKRLLPFQALSLFSLCACSSTPALVKKVYFAFDTAVTVSLYGGETDLFAEIRSVITEYNQLFDSFNAYTGVNNVYTVNHSSEAVNVPEKLFKALKTADSLKTETDGYFNPYIGALSNAWKDALKEGTVLEDAAIQDYLTDMNGTSLSFDEENQAVTRNGSGEIDLGAFAKGYVLSEIRMILDAHNFTDYLIDCGSSSILLGDKPGADSFRVGLKYYSDKYMELSETSIGTSSVFEQKTEIDGVTYTHIINPFTGSAVTAHDFVLTVDEDSVRTDVYSTAMMNMSVSAIRELEKEKGFRVLVIDDGDITYQSEDLEVKKR